VSAWRRIACSASSIAGGAGSSARLPCFFGKHP
jgi:hypothetical protein